MPSEPLPIFCGHPDRPVDPPPELAGRKKKSKNKSPDPQVASRRTDLASGNLFEPAPDPPLATTTAPDVAVPPSTAALENPTQINESNRGSETNGTVTSAVEPPV